LTTGNFYDNISLPGKEMLHYIQFNPNNVLNKKYNQVNKKALRNGINCVECVIETISKR